jgi:hypothetical protein
VLNKREVNYMLGITGKFIVRCMVSVGDTGTHWAVLKGPDGRVIRFDTQADADQRAADLNIKHNGPSPREYSRYWSEAECTGSELEWTA